MDGGRVPGWNGESGEDRWIQREEDASWPDQGAQKRLILVGRILTSLIAGTIPAILLAGFHPTAVWLLASSAIFWALGPAAKRVVERL